MNENFDFFSFEDLFTAKKSVIHDQNLKVKVIGDRVKVINPHSITYLNGMELTDGDLGELDSFNHLVVISTNEHTVFTTKYATYNQDVIIAEPKTKKMYRISSRHIKIVDL